MNLGRDHLTIAPVERAVPTDPARRERGQPPYERARVANTHVFHKFCREPQHVISLPLGKFAAEKLNS